MKTHHKIITAIAAWAALSVPALATQTINLPNGVAVQYAGSGAPQFFVLIGLAVTGGWEVRDTDTGNRYYYNLAGDWLAVTGPSAGSVPGAPAVPTTITSPLTGSVLPFQLSGTPIVAVRGINAYEVMDIAGGRVFLYDGGDVLLNTGPVAGSSPLTGSSSFGGTSSGVTSTTSGVTSSGDGSNSFCIQNCFPSGGGTDVPGPAVFALFGLAAGGIAVSRRRKRSKNDPANQMNKRPQCGIISASVL